ncbi:Frizzled-2 (Fragment) [Geodia barretti]|uniref:Frizzled-2 n=1 Tax=Geodia barretti TaxID=519541 RepID=A0AA35SAR9_GEOBA
MTPHLTIARLFLGLLLFCAVHGLPANRRHWFYPAFQQRDPLGAECVVLDDHPCNVMFNRTEGERYAKFPNSRGMTLEGSKREFMQYYTLFNLKPPGCYLEMWSLLCFHYFPQCRPGLPLKYIATPCRETCQRARTGCDDFLRERNITWPEHLECAKFNSSHDDHLCVNRSAVEQVTLPAPTPTSSAPTSGSSPTSNVPTTSRPTTRPTTTTSTPNNTPEPPAPQCHSRCKFRTRANGGTFRNNDYTFAANVTVISSSSLGTTDRHAFLAVITRYWVLDSQNCSHFENHTYIIIRTSYSHCPPCPGFNTTAGENVYLVAGYCNDRGWYLPPTDSLVSPWNLNRMKYETKLEGWIGNAMEQRRQSQ